MDELKGISIDIIESQILSLKDPNKVLVLYIDSDQYIVHANSIHKVIKTIKDSLQDKGIDPRRVVMIPKNKDDKSRISMSLEDTDKLIDDLTNYKASLLIDNISKIISK